MRSTLHALLPVLLVLLAACAGPSGPFHAPNTSDEGLALAGFDPVAYFPEGGGEPARGEPDLTAEHAGATYRFASAEHRERFLADPARYAPAYGGWCAWAMADGERVEVDPRSYLLQNGRLLLFYDGVWGDTRAMWLENQPLELEQKADAAWAAGARDGAEDGAEDATGDARG